jgi:hypothetical protein
VKETKERLKKLYPAARLFIRASRSLALVFCIAYVGLYIFIIKDVEDENAEWAANHRRWAERAKRYVDYSGALGGRFQVGDIVLDIPFNQRITHADNSPDDLTKTPKKVEIDPSAKFAGKLRFMGEDALKLAGILPDDRLQDAPRLDITIEFNYFAVVPPEVLCARPNANDRPDGAWNEFLIINAPTESWLVAPGKTFLGAPLMIRKLRNNSYREIRYSYVLIVWLSEKVAVYVELEDRDLDKIGLGLLHAISNIEGNLKSWISATPFPAKRLLREDPSSCESLTAAVRARSDGASPQR